MQINDYHSRHEIRFRPLSEIGEYPLYMGAEVEVDAKRDVRNWNTTAFTVAINRTGFLEYFYPTNDGSLSNGCEFVSDPCTLKAWEGIKPEVKDGFKVLVDSGLRAHQTSTCGLHVHASKAFFGESWLSAATNMLAIIEHNWEPFTHFARRGNTHYGSRRLSSFSSRERALFKSGGISPDNERYRAINIRNAGTIEFRLFKGTLNIETFYATLQMVDNLCRMARFLTMDEALMVGFADIISFRAYPELDAYCKRIKVAENKECVYADDGVEE